MLTLYSKVKLLMLFLRFLQTALSEGFIRLSYTKQSKKTYEKLAFQQLKTWIMKKIFKCAIDFKNLRK